MVVINNLFMVLLQLQVIPLIKAKLSGKGQGRSTQACQLIKKQS
jgi:hypothetical protein